jgi:hypothetical protein
MQAFPVVLHLGNWKLMSTTCIMVNLYKSVSSRLVMIKGVRKMENRRCGRLAQEIRP